MQTLLLFLMLGINFFISWQNASCSGRYWTESKEVGGSFRAQVVSGYAMSIAGFTMVYGYILLLILPFLLQIAGVDQEVILSFESLSSDLIYLFCIITIVPIGFFIWLRSLRKFWENKTLSYGINAGWNTYAQIHNTINVARNAPSALGRVTKVLFGGKGNKKGNAIIALCAILVLIIAIFGGYFTASAIMKKADREYDMFSRVQTQ